VETRHGKQHHLAEKKRMQQQSPVGTRKVVIVGAGAVGATFGYALAQSGLADEIALMDRNEELATGQVLDLAHGQPFVPSVQIRVGRATDYADADVIVVTAGAAQRPGETRLALLQKNAAIIRSIVDDIREQDSSAAFVVVSNPVDILTHVALKHSGWERARVFGSGTVLDSARLRYLLSQHCGIDAHNVHAYVLGEHGDSEFAAWSMTNIAGIRMDDYCRTCDRCGQWMAERARIEQQVRDSAYHIIDYKGATSFAVGLALVRIVAAVLRGQRSVLTVSTLLDGEFGLRDVCLSVPCIVSDSGIEKILESPLPSGELESLEKSAALLKGGFTSLDPGP
jgi:L-lactate dehydrogenase